MPNSHGKSIRNVNASLDSLSFDTTGYRYEGDTDGLRTWLTPEGDAIWLSFLPEPPDLPIQPQSCAELREFYRGRVCNEQVRMVEFGLRRVADITCIWTVLKTPQKPHGMLYMGFLTIPFAEFSFVITMLCKEYPITGAREAAWLLVASHEGRITFRDDGEPVGDSSPDDECYDKDFPKHPVSRLRRGLARIIATLQIQDRTKNEKRFELP